MLGVRVEATKTRPMAKTVRSAPGPLPKAKRPDKRVFLPATLWESLSEVAAFHEETFKAMGRDESVSRNDIIEDFLKWAEDEYWSDKGGKPKTAAERSKKIADYAKQLRKEEDAAKADGALNGTDH